MNGGRRGWALAAVTLTVLAVTVGVAALRPAGHRAGGAGATPGTAVPVATAEGVVPWAPLPWTPPPVPAESSPAPRPHTAPPCRAAGLAPSFDRENGAGGHLVVFLHLRNTGAAPCLLDGYPRVTALQPGRPAVAATAGSWVPDPGSADAAPGTDAWLGLETVTYCPARPGGGGGLPRYHHLDVVLPSGDHLALGNADGFDVTCGLFLTHFFVPRPDPTPPPDPTAALRVSLELPATVVAGTTLTYVAVLSNPTDRAIALRPCPGFLQNLTEPVVKDLHTLNCGRAPVVPAGGAVRFAMRLPVPASARPGPVTVRWFLASASGGRASATVRVVAR